MPATIYAPNGPMAQAADQIAAAFASGAGARVSLGSGDLAFTWSTGLPPGLYSNVAHGVTDAHSVPISTYSPTGTPAVVAPGGQKPVLVANGGLVDKALVKLPGLYSGPVEEFFYAAGAALAVYRVLVGQILSGIDGLTLDAIEAAAGAPPAGGTSPGQAILAAQAAVMTAGGSPSFAVVSPSDYVTLISAETGNGYLNLVNAETGPTGYLYGLALVVSAGQTDGTVTVGDGSAVLIIEHSASPVMIADPTYDLAHNLVALAAEWFGVPAVVSPAGVAARTWVAGP